MLRFAPSDLALRYMTRATIGSSKEMTATHQPLSALAMNNFIICPSGSLFPANNSSSLSSRPLRTGGVVSVASLGDGLSHLTLQKQSNNQQKNSFTIKAPNNNHAKHPLGERITYLSLNNLSDNPGAVRKGRRVGRGIGSSKGKTCGRGHKGQKARAGRGVHPTFEGGQTKFYKRLPKKGKMKNHKFKLNLIPINIGKVQDYVTMGRLIPERSDGVITMRDFVKAGMFPNSSVKSGVKLLGDGKEHLKDKLHIEVPWASRTAIEAVESRGGFVTTVHYNRLALRALLKPERFSAKPERMLTLECESGGGDDAVELDLHDTYLLPRRARPPPKYMPYYTDYAKRGYLNPKVQLERKKRGLKDILLKY